jgi:hypothetical protein
VKYFLDSTPVPSAGATPVKYAALLLLQISQGKAGQAGQAEIGKLKG